MLRWRNAYLISPLCLGSSSSFKLNNNFLGFCFSWCSEANLSTLYSWLSNFDKICAIFFGKRKQVLMSARTQFICLIGSIKLFKNFSICYFFPLHLVLNAICHFLISSPFSVALLSHLPPEHKMTLWQEETGKRVLLGTHSSDCYIFGAFFCANREKLHICVALFKSLLPVSWERRRLNLKT